MRLVFQEGLLTVTPMAVTSAPAPAPWMMSGRGEYLRSAWSSQLDFVAYRAVVNEMMLSDPFKAVAKAWSKSYL